MEKIIELLKSINYQVSKELLFNYKKMNITDSEFILIIYLINQSSNIYNPKQISNDLTINLNEVLETINSLCEKGIIVIEMQKINNIRNEIINLNQLYEKLAFTLDNPEKKDNNNIYSIFEEEFGRTLSPMEYEIISGWIDNGYNKEIIIMALKEATYNGVSNLRYIDKIIYEWGKKGIKNKADVEKDKRQFKSNNSKIKEFIEEYDWLNDENS